MALMLWGVHAGVGETPVTIVELYQTTFTMECGSGSAAQRHVRGLPLQPLLASDVDTIPGKQPAITTSVGW